MLELPRAFPDEYKDIWSDNVLTLAPTAKLTANMTQLLDLVFYADHATHAVA